MELYFGAHLIIPGETISHQIAQEELVLKWFPPDNDSYTFILYDLDSPRGVFTHWLKVHNTETHEGEELLRYIPPDPMYQPSRFVFSILRENTNFFHMQETSRIGAYNYLIELEPKVFVETGFIVDLENN